MDEEKKIENLENHLAGIKKTVSELLGEHGGLMDQELLLEVLTILAIDAKSSEKDKDSYKKHFDFIISKYFHILSN